MTTENPKPDPTDDSYSEYWFPDLNDPELIDEEKISAHERYLEMYWPRRAAYDQRVRNDQSYDRRVVRSPEGTLSTPTIRSPHDWKKMLEAVPSIRIPEGRWVELKALFAIKFKNGDDEEDLLWMSIDMPQRSNAIYGGDNAQADQIRASYMQVIEYRGQEKRVSGEIRHGVLVGEQPVNFAGECWLQVSKTSSGEYQIILIETNDRSGGYAPRMVVDNRYDLSKEKKIASVFAETGVSINPVIFDRARVIAITKQYDRAFASATKTVADERGIQVKIKIGQIFEIAVGNPDFDVISNQSLLLFVGQHNRAALVFHHDSQNTEHLFASVGNGIQALTIVGPKAEGEKLHVHRGAANTVPDELKSLHIQCEVLYDSNEGVFAIQRPVPNEEKPVRVYLPPSETRKK